MNTRKKNDAEQKVQAHSIVFGFDRATDEQSLHMFLQRFTDKKVLAVLLPRLHDEDIFTTVDFLTAIMQKHLSEKEYHTLFLKE
ncbi:MAG: hypothetical protein AMJ60_05130 [Desulfobacterales bacterium SG8_35]|nr:MAG: hypothetical protein AMJ60_05130 [Desulfobacterales bacterium SG8_35]